MTRINYSLIFFWTLCMAFSVSFWWSLLRLAGIA